ncbi:MAG: TIGR02444 family protein [Alphaproteobacteria bacterium]|nr:TIGR02444 family protein [Alphaproteobacteria bacterium]
MSERRNESRMPIEDLWHWSQVVYARPGVAEALIALQDHDGADVNVLLAALWSGARGAERWTDEDLDRILALSTPWQAHVIGPLRQARRALKSMPTAEAQRLREGVKRLELDAEACVLGALAAFLFDRPGSGAHHGAANVERYLDRCSDRTPAVAARLADLIGAIGRAT